MGWWRRCDSIHTSRFLVWDITIAGWFDYMMKCELLGAEVYGYIYVIVVFSFKIKELKIETRFTYHHFLFHTSCFLVSPITASRLRPHYFLSLYRNFVSAWLYCISQCFPRRKMLLYFSFIGCFSFQIKCLYVWTRLVSYYFLFHLSSFLGRDLTLSCLETSLFISVQGLG